MVILGKARKSREPGRLTPTPLPALSEKKTAWVTHKMKRTTRGAEEAGMTPKKRLRI